MLTVIGIWVTTEPLGAKFMNVPVIPPTVAVVDRKGEAKPLSAWLPAELK